MLSNTQTRETFEFQYSGIFPSTNDIISFPDKNAAWELVAARTEITAQAQVVISSLIFQTPQLVTVMQVGIIPWLFASTTVETTMGQTPEVPIANLFAFSVSGFIPKGFHIYDGWRVRFFDFLQTTFVAFNVTLTFAKAEPL